MMHRYYLFVNILLCSYFLSNILLILYKLNVLRSRDLFLTAIADCSNQLDSKAEGLKTIIKP